MKSYDAKEWDRLVPGADSLKKKIKRAKIESKVSASKKIKKMNLK
jgi:hypothetical protein